MDAGIQQQGCSEVAKMYADDAVFSNPGWTASGRAAIEEGLKKDIAAGVFKVNTITVDQSHRVGDMNYAWGGWTADMKTPDGKEVPVQGHWTVVSRCQGDNCLTLDHNSNMAMPPPK
jgi:ketosteroid isomerase-like protein